MAAQSPQRGSRIGLIREDEPADDGIEFLLWRKSIELNGLEMHGRVSGRSDAPSRNVERLGGAVDTEHRPGRADHGRG